MGDSNPWPCCLAHRSQAPGTSLDSVHERLTSSWPLFRCPSARLRDANLPRSALARRHPPPFSYASSRDSVARRGPLPHHVHPLPMRPDPEGLLRSLTHLLPARTSEIT